MSLTLKYADNLVFSFLKSILVLRKDNVSVKGLSTGIEVVELYLRSNDKKNGVLWSQARMRIEIRLKCYLVI